MEENGYKVWIVEHWNQWARVRRDLFLMCDLVAIREDTPGITGVQCCSEDVQPHLKKLLEGYTDGKGKTWGPNEYLPIWLQAGNRFFIWSWCLRGKQGKRKVYRLRQIEFLLKDGRVEAHEIPNAEEASSL